MTKQQKREFARGLQAPELNSGDSPSPIDPDFVIELMFPICEAVSFRTDDRDELQRKMQEYRDCGVKLGWSIDPDAKQIEIYRSSQQKSEILDNPQNLSGENVLPNLTVNLREILED